MNKHTFDELVAGYLEGALREVEIGSLLQAVESSPLLREQFQQEIRLHTLLRETMSDQIEIDLLKDEVLAFASPQRKWIRWLTVMNVAALLIACGLWYSSANGSDRDPGLGVCLSVTGSSEVHIERGATELPLAAEVRLYAGDRIKCGDHARTMVRLNDGSILSLDEGTQLAIVSDRPEIRLEKGEVHFEVAERAPGALAFQVHTNESTIDVMGTVFGLSSDGQTRLDVYEGRVSMLRHSDRARVEVGPRQTASTLDGILQPHELALAPMKTVSLLPSDDATLEGETNDGYGYHLKVEAKRRLVYLQFSIPGDLRVNSAVLQLTQDIDSGAGNLQVHLADRSEWDEASLTKSNAPGAVRVVAEHRGVVSRGQVVKFDVTEAVVRPGPITFILTLDRSGQNDIWFGSRSGLHPPRLVVSSPDER